MLATDLYLHNAPIIYARFCAQIDAAIWCNRVRSLENSIRRNSILREHLFREHEITFALARLDLLAGNHGTVPIPLVTRAEFSALAFAAQIISLIDYVTPAEAEQLRGRVRGALANSDEMRGLRLEMTAITHFIRRGNRVELPSAGQERIYDFLVSDICNGGLEVECKSMSRDKGRKIHDEEAIEFYGLIKPMLDPVLSGLRHGLSAVLTLPGRLPTTNSNLILLAKDVARALYGGVDCTLQCGATLRLLDFMPNTAGADFDDKVRMRRMIDSVSGTENRQSLVLGSNAGAVLALTVQSARDDSVIKAMFDTMSDAARYQLSRERAGMLFVSLDGIGNAALVGIGNDEKTPGMAPTLLRVAADRFLRSPDRSHVVNVAFVSRNVITPAVNHTHSSGGSTYSFANRISKFWTEDFSGIFREAG